MFELLRKFNEATGRRIAIVGNGPTAPEAAAEIDAYPIVVRFNRCQHFPHSGKKTDILVLSNSGYPGEHFAYDPEWIKPETLRDAKQAWLVRSPKVLAESIASALPDQVEFYGDYTNEIIENILAEKSYKIFPRGIHDRTMGALAKAGAGGLFIPSAGVLALMFLRRRYWFYSIDLFGFTHEGWEFHPWEAERKWIDSLGVGRKSNSW